GEAVLRQDWSHLPSKVNRRESLLRRSGLCDGGAENDTKGNDAN
ncbi:MAG: hypothetical protein ACI91B_002709, partial [Planctomycetota bacterium]